MSLITLPLPASITVLLIAMRIGSPLITPPAVRSASLIPMLTTVLALAFVLGDAQPILHVLVIPLMASTSACLSALLHFSVILLDCVSACLSVQLAITRKMILLGSVWHDAILAHMDPSLHAC